MNDDYGGRRPWRRTRSRRAGLLVAAASIALLATACGSTGGAGTASSASASPGSSSPADSGGSSNGNVATQAQQLSYARCMRAHGMPDFPDPSPGGGFGGRTAGMQGDPNYQTANDACHGLLPAGGGANKAQQNVSAFLQHAQCMRAHGVPDYPDPQPGVNPRTALQQAGINVNSPQVAAASRACDRLLPQPGGTASPGGAS